MVFVMVGNLEGIHLTQLMTGRILLHVRTIHEERGRRGPDYGASQRRS